MRGRPTPTQAELRREHGGRGPVQEPRDGEGRMSGALRRLVGDDVSVLCVDGEERRVVDLDNAASTPALPAVVERVMEFLPLQQRPPGSGSEVPSLDGRLRGGPP